MARRPEFLVLTIITILVAIGCAAVTSSPPAASPNGSGRTLINPHPDMGYSDASVYGDLIFTAGHLPFEANSTDPFETQVETVLDDLEATLQASGGGFDTVLKTNVYLLSFDDWPVFNDVYTRRLGQYGLPPRSTLQVSGLGLGRIEIEMIAYRR
jgi:enamine deaminase RidA (YjgF/YER057c/UK114 family)